MSTCRNWMMPAATNPLPGSISGREAKRYFLISKIRTDGAECLPMLSNPLEKEEATQVEGDRTNWSKENEVNTNVVVLRYRRL